MKEADFDVRHSIHNDSEYVFRYKRRNGAGNLTVFGGAIINYYGMAIGGDATRVATAAVARFCSSV